MSLVSLSLGYYLGQRSKPPQFKPEVKATSYSELPDVPAPVPAAASPPAVPQPAEESSDSEEEDGADVDLKAVSAGLFEECKLVRLCTVANSVRRASLIRVLHSKVLVVRSDLGMTKGKIAAQCG